MITKSQASLALVALALLLGACDYGARLSDERSSTGELATPDVVATLKSFNFVDAFLDHVEVQEVEDSQRARGVGNMGSNFIALTTTEQDLTPSERAAAFGYRVPGGRWVTTDRIQEALSAYYRANGRFPATGVELAVFRSPALASPDYIAKLSNRSTAEQIAALGFINPVTGRLYESFDNEDWHPGGVFIRQARDAEFEARYKFTAEMFRKMGEPLPEAFIMCFFGEEPGHILVRDMMYYCVPNDSGYFTHPSVEPVFREHDPGILDKAHTR